MAITAYRITRDDEATTAQITTDISAIIERLNYLQRLLGAYLDNWVTDEDINTEDELRNYQQ